MPWLLLIFLVSLWSCGGIDLSTQNLTHPEILMLRSDPPALIPPQTVTASVRLYDPERRAQAVHWYIPIRFSLYDLERFGAITDRLVNPEEAIPNGFLYLGSGFKVEVPIPSLPVTQALEGVGLDTFPLPLLAVIVLQGEKPLKGIKRLRLVIPELVKETLTREYGRPPTESELEEALAIRLNRNPEVTGVSLLGVPPQGPYPEEAMNDLKVRRELASLPLTLPVLTGAGGLRMIPLLHDPDLARARQRGEPGFNFLTVTYLSPQGEFFHLSVSSADWVPIKFRNQSLFTKPEKVPVPPGIKTLYLTIFDHQGGVTLTALDLLYNDPSPPDPPPGTSFAYLLENNGRLLWLYAPQSLTGSVTEPVTLTVRLYPNPSLPLGVTGVVTQDPPSLALANLDLLEADPLSTREYLEKPVRLPGRVIREISFPLRPGSGE